MKTDKLLVPVNITYADGSKLVKRVDVLVLGFTARQWRGMGEDEKKVASNLIEGKHFNTGENK